MLRIKSSSIFKLSLLCLYLVSINGAPNGNSLETEEPNLQQPKIPEVRVKFGERSSINCTVSKSCDEKFKWTKIGSSEKMDLKRNSKGIAGDDSLMILNFDKVTHDDNGTYVCSCSNISEVQRNVEQNLIVTDVPEVKIDFAQAISNGEVYLNWTVNAHNEPIINYTIEYQKHDETSPWKNSTDHRAVGETSVILTELENGAAYRFRICAENSIGKSLLGIYSKMITTSPREDEDPEYIPRISSHTKSDHSINVTLESPPEALKKNNYSYKLTIAGGNQSEEQSADSGLNQREVSFQNLIPETIYKIKACACREFTKKCGSWSEEEEIQTLNEGETSGSAMMNGPTTTIVTILSYFFIKQLM